MSARVRCSLVVCGTRGSRGGRPGGGERVVEGRSVGGGEVGEGGEVRSLERVECSGGGGSDEGRGGGQVGESVC